MGFTPTEVWEMTPYEFQMCLKGNATRVDQQMDQLAWLAAILLSPHTKKGRTIRPSQLRGKGGRTFVDKDQYLDHRRAQRENADSKDLEAFQRSLGQWR